MSDIRWTTEKRRLGDLIKWEQNPRQLTADQAVRLRRSIDEFGYSQLYEIEPDNTIVDGHQRDEVMLRMEQFGPGAQIEVRVASRKLTLEERKAYIALKHRGAMGEWNWDEMHNLYEFEELEGFGFDVDELLAAGFEPDEEALPEDPGADIDRAEELREKWGVETGQLWQLGEHRLICGDCTDAEVVGRVMGEEQAGASVTDPPYNVDKDKWDVNVMPMLKRAADLLPSIIGDGVCFWFCSTRYIPDTIMATSALPYRWMFIWYPSNNMAHGDLGFQKFTPALVLSSGKIHRPTMQDLREYPIKITNADPGHPTPKPIELITYIVEQIDVDIYFDGFLGSGTTLIACERLGRKCRAAEISPAYCAVAIERWVEMTGQEPVILQD